MRNTGGEDNKDASNEKQDKIKCENPNYFEIKTFGFLKSPPFLLGDPKVVGAD